MYNGTASLYEQQRNKLLLWGGGALMFSSHCLQGADSEPFYAQTMYSAIFSLFRKENLTCAVYYLLCLSVLVTHNPLGGYSGIFRALCVCGRYPECPSSPPISLSLVTWRYCHSVYAHSLLANVTFVYGFYVQVEQQTRSGLKTTLTLFDVEN
jgi:hypothetical protein